MIQGIYKSGNNMHNFEDFLEIEKVFEVEIPRVFKDFIVKFQGVEIDYNFLENFKLEKGYSPIHIYANGKQVAMVRFNQDDFFFDRNDHERFSEDYALPKRLIAFADEGAGRYFCFDFDKEKDGKVPIILIMPDAKEEFRGLYIADDFEQFLEMIGNPEMEAPYYHVPYYDVEEE